MKQRPRPSTTTAARLKVALARLAELEVENARLRNQYRVLANFIDRLNCPTNGRHRPSDAV